MLKQISNSRQRRVVARAAGIGRLLRFLQMIQKAYYFPVNCLCSLYGIIKLLFQKYSCECFTAPTQQATLTNTHSQKSLHKIELLGDGGGKCLTYFSESAEIRNKICGELLQKCLIANILNGIYFSEVTQNLQIPLGLGNIFPKCSISILFYSVTQLDSGSGTFGIMSFDIRSLGIKPFGLSVI